MKKLHLLLSTAVLFLLVSCSNEFDVAAPWKEIPVAYAILSPKDTAHYIRVEKAFLDPVTNALVIAQIADSIYYPADAVTVWLERTSNQTRVQLQRVDGVLEGIVRDTGVFATNPNWLYKYKPAPGAGLIAGEKYRLIIERNDGKAPITAETTLPKDFLFIKPNPAQIPPLINFFPTVPTDLEWRCDQFAVLFDVFVTVRYREEDANGNTLQHVALNWKAPGQVTLDDLGGSGLFRGKMPLSGTEFYRFLNLNVLPSTDKFRYFEDMDIRLIGGGKEIKEYLVTANANAGITGAEIIPTYTNLSEGYGIFSAKNTDVLTKIKVTPKTVDSMLIHPLTRDLNFKY
ncbi:MAG: DUF4249 family protein [Lewinellaceae bacterium]|nr:DUF4249 family protein [Lewinellaceae bacterium]